VNATSKLVKAWESKNTKNAAKAGGISLMALSLAACGGSSSTPDAGGGSGSGSSPDVGSLQLTDREIVRLQQQLAIAQTARNAYAQALNSELPQDV